MRGLLSPAHKTWLVRGGVVVATIGALATWLVTHPDSPSTTRVTTDKESVHAGPTTSEIAEIARRATVLIVPTDRRGTPIGQGTGFFLSSDGLLATNYHVIQRAGALRIETLDGDLLPPVYLVATDSAHDLAVLRVERLNGAFLRLATQQTPEVGNPVYVMGNPLGQIGTFSSGVVSAVRELGGRDLVQITAPISPGSSGGPVLNGAGEVIGVATLNLRNGQNMNFAVSARYLPAMLVEKSNAVPFAQAARAAAETQARLTRQTNTTRSLAAFNAAIDRQFAVADSIAQTVGYVAESSVVHDFLEQSSVKRHAVNVDNAGTYLIQGFCDEDCSHMSLSIQDADGRVLDLDKGENDRPTLIFDADARGHYTVQVSMLSCSVSPCAYGVRLYRANPPR